VLANADVRPLPERHMPLSLAENIKPVWIFERALITTGTAIETYTRSQG
jgi:hypothetical protein